MHRDTKYHESIIWTAICQHIRQPRRKREFLEHTTCQDFIKIKHILNTSITSNTIEFVTKRKKPLSNKSPGLDNFTCDFYQTYKEVVPALIKLSCLANPMDWGIWRATVHRVSKSWTRLKWLTMHACTHELDLTDRCRTLHWKTAVDAFVSSAHGTDQVLGCKTRDKKFRRIEMMSNFFTTTV